MTPSGQAGGGAGGGAPSSAGANGSTVRSAALVTLGVVIGLAVVAVMAIARSDPAARGVPTTFRQHGSANDRTMLRPGGDASNLDAARVDRAGRAPSADGASEQESSQAGDTDDSPVPPVVTVSYADTYLGSGIPGGGTVKQVNVTADVPVNRRAGGWMVEHGEAQSPFDIQRAEYIPYPHVCGPCGRVDSTRSLVTCVFSLFCTGRDGDCDGRLGKPRSCNIMPCSKHSPPAPF